MIRPMRVLFCDNDHGCGDVIFPDVQSLAPADIINAPTSAHLRKAARADGWRRVKGCDYCPGCSEMKAWR